MGNRDFCCVISALLKRLQVSEVRLTQKELIAAMPLELVWEQGFCDMERGVRIKVRTR
jgi:hypothetical protein